MDTICFSLLVNSCKEPNLRAGVVNRITTGVNVEIGAGSPDVGCMCEAQRYLLIITDFLTL